MQGFDKYRERLMPALMTILYYICFMPGGFILGLFRLNTMQGKPDPTKQSYWKKRAAHGLAEPMKHPF